MNQKENSNPSGPLVGLVMGSRSDWETMEQCSLILKHFGIAHECQVVSAHRTPDLMCQYAKGAAERGIQVIVAGAGGAAHLPGMIASMTVLPVVGVPVQSRALSGLDSLLSIVQMPGGVPVATMAIGSAGAKNAGLYAARVLATTRPKLQSKVQTYLDQQRDTVLSDAPLQPNFLGDNESSAE